MVKVELDLTEKQFEELQELKKDLDLDDSLAVAAAIKDMLYTDIPYSSMEYGRHQWDLETKEFEYSKFYYQNQDEFNEDCNCYHCRWNKIIGECKNCGFETTKNKLEYCGPTRSCIGKRICPTCHKDFYKFGE